MKTKKLISLALSLLMAAGMSVSAFANTAGVQKDLSVGASITTSDGQVLPLEVETTTEEIVGVHRTAEGASPLYKKDVRVSRDWKGNSSNISSCYATATIYYYINNDNTKELYRCDALWEPAANHEVRNRKMYYGGDSSGSYSPSSNRSELSVSKKGRSVYLNTEARVYNTTASTSLYDTITVRVSA